MESENTRRLFNDLVQVKTPGSRPRGLRFRLDGFLCGSQVLIWDGLFLVPKDNDEDVPASRYQTVSAVVKGSKVSIGLSWVQF